MSQKTFSVNMEMSTDMTGQFHEKKVITWSTAWYVWDDGQETEQTSFFKNLQEFLELWKSNLAKILRKESMELTITVETHENDFSTRKTPFRLSFYTSHGAMKDAYYGNSLSQKNQKHFRFPYIGDGEEIYKKSVSKIKRQFSTLELSNQILNLFGEYRRGNTTMQFDSHNTQTIEL